MHAVPDIRFYRLIQDAPAPRRADRSAMGTLPTRAARYCDAVTSASAFGWHVYSPLDFSLYWDGTALFWSYGDMEDWMPLGAAQYPYFAGAFDEVAPDEAKGCSPPFLSALPEPGTVQLWTGLIARTAPEWSILVRAPANLPGMGGFTSYEGIVETDRWFGPLFVNLRMTRSHSPVRISTEMPLAQIQPLHRMAYSEEVHQSMSVVDTMNAADWKNYIETIVVPNRDPGAQAGRYAVAARRRRKGECPITGRS